MVWFGHVACKTHCQNSCQLSVKRKFLWVQQNKSKACFHYVCVCVNREGDYETQLYYLYLKETKEIALLTVWCPVSWQLHATCMREENTITLRMGQVNNTWSSYPLEDYVWWIIYFPDLSLFLQLLMYTRKSRTKRWTARKIMIYQQPSVCKKNTFAARQTLR